MVYPSIGFDKTDRNDLIDTADIIPVFLLKELGVPEGKLLQELPGGGESLRSTLEDLSHYKLTGYITTTLSREQDQAEGIIAYQHGDPTVAAYVYYRNGMTSRGRLYLGAKAVAFVYEDALHLSTVLRVNSMESIEPISSFFEEGRVNKTDLISPTIPEEDTLTPDRVTSVILNGSVETDITPVEVNKLASELILWSRGGYDVSSLLNMYQEDAEAALRALPYYTEMIARGQALKVSIANSCTDGSEREVESVLRMLKDPQRVGQAEKLYKELVGKSDPGQQREAIHKDMEMVKAKEKENDVYNLILRYDRLMKATPDEKRCDLCGRQLIDGRCHACEGGAMGKAINPALTFNNFVVGPNNRFAFAATKASVENLGQGYNPLFVYSGSGLGKTHLLHAMGNMTAGGGKRVIYSPADGFESDLIDALGSNQLEDLRTRLVDCDLLLVDDVQFLAGKDRLQEELALIYNELMLRGGQVVFACDRLPRDVPTLSERLVTRFESGLVIDIGPPDLQTRMAILAKAAEIEGHKLPKPVTEFIAQLCDGSVRELKGCLNRVMAFSSLMKRSPDLELAKEILSFKAADRDRVEDLPRILLSGGHSYLFEEWKPDSSYKLMSLKMGEGYAGMAISRSNPKVIRERLPDGSAKVCWLTDRESMGNETIEPSLEKLILNIEIFLEKNERSVILLDDIHYLLGNTSFDGFIKFIRRIVDQISEGESIFLLSADPAGLDDRERSILEREMEVLGPSLKGASARP